MLCDDCDLDVPETEPWDNEPYAAPDNLCHRCAERRRVSEATLKAIEALDQAAFGYGLSWSREQLFDARGRVAAARAALIAAIEAECERAHSQGLAGRLRGEPLTAEERKP